MKKKRFKSHFRFGKKILNNGHPTYIYAKVDNEYKFIGLTHAPVTKGIKNIKLDKNPNPKDEKISYARNRVFKASDDKFGNKLSHWEFCDSDKDKIKKIVKYDENKTQKKK